MTEPQDKNATVNLNKPRSDVPGWVEEATRQPSPSPTPPPPASASPLGSLTQNDVSTRKLVAGLLGIFLGSLGVHKFYLGLTTPGLVMLLINIGGWFITGVLSIITFGIGAIFLFPLMSLVSAALGIIGLIEGIVYLTRSDAEFEQLYLIGKKPWF